MMKSHMVEPHCLIDKPNSRLFPAIVAGGKNGFFSVKNGFIVLGGTKQLHRRVSGDPDAGAIDGAFRWM
jgi:hypothetical protein